jgi:flagella basal body P-ring formation protein FlgA
VDGKFLSKAVAAGDWIPCASLRAPPSVRRNQELVVLYSAPGLELRGRGVARKDAWPGDEILVRVAGADRDCRAEVIGPGTVQVGLPGEAQ